MFEIRYSKYCQNLVYQSLFTMSPIVCLSVCLGRLVAAGEGEGRGWKKRLKEEAAKVYLSFLSFSLLLFLHPLF